MAELNLVRFSKKTQEFFAPMCARRKKTRLPIVAAAARVESKSRNKSNSTEGDPSMHVLGGPSLRIQSTPQVSGNPSPHNFSGPSRSRIVKTR
jgi:hypothetical protein